MIPDVNYVPPEAWWHVPGERRVSGADLNRFLDTSPELTESVDLLGFVAMRVYRDEYFLIAVDYTGVGITIGHLPDDASVLVNVIALQ